MAIGAIASQWVSKMRVSLRYRLEYAVVMTIRTVVRVLPRRVSLSFGTAVGGIFYLLHGRRRELAMSNLRMTFPNRTDFECRTILRASFAQLGRHCIDFLNFDAMEADEMFKLVEFEGEKYVENAIAQGRGVMYFAGHFGAWELQIMVHAFRFQRIVMVARTLDNPLLETLIERIRTRVGTQVLSRRGAVRGLLRALKNGGSVGLMVDQHIQDRSAVQVNYLGRPASTTSTIASLALRSGAPIIPVFAMPLPGGRYRMVYEKPIEVPCEEDDDRVRTYTQRCTDRLEARVLRDPYLWLWMHRRWRGTTASN